MHAPRKESLHAIWVWNRALMLEHLADGKSKRESKQKNPSLSYIGHPPHEAQDSKSHPGSKALRVESVEQSRFQAPNLCFREERRVQIPCMVVQAVHGTGKK